MFYLLMLIGIIFIVLGLREDKEIVGQAHDFEELKDRIESLESILYEVNIDPVIEEELVVRDEDVTYESVAKSIKSPDRSIKIFNSLKQCEEEGYSLEEMCLLLNMNKGEVLLLKNLYRNYQS